MKGLALGGLLICGLAAVLVFVATNGIGMRSPTFAPLTYSAIQSKPQKMTDETPVVQVESKPTDANALMPAMPAPEVKVTRSERRHKRTTKAHQVTNAPLAIVPAEKAGPAIPKVKAKSVVEKTEAVEPPKARPEPQKEPEPIVHPRDVSDAGPMSQLEADREWRRQTLARWRHEAQNRRDGGLSSTLTRARPGDEPSLKGSAVEGLYPADPQRSEGPQKKKKRHRILFIRW
jgi:hypothetical protein